MGLVRREQSGISLASENYCNFNTDDIPFHRYPFRRSFGLRSAREFSYAAYTLWPGKLKFYSGITLRKRGATFENCYALLAQPLNVVRGKSIKGISNPT